MAKEAMNAPVVMLAEPKKVTLPQRIPAGEMAMLEVISVYPSVIYTFQVRLKEAEALLEKLEAKAHDIFRDQIIQAEEKKRGRVPYNVQFYQNRAWVPECFMDEMRSREGWGTIYVTIDDLAKWFNSGVSGQQGRVRQFLGELKRRALNVQTDNAENIDLQILSNLGEAGNEAARLLKQIFTEFESRGLGQKEMVDFLKQTAKEMRQK